MARRSRILVLNVATRYCDSRRLALESHRGRPAKTRKLKYIHQQNPERGLANQAQARNPRSRSVLKWSLLTVPASQQRGQAAVDRLTSDGPGWYRSDEVWVELRESLSPSKQSVAFGKHQSAAEARPARENRGHQTFSQRRILAPKRGVSHDEALS